MPLPIAAEIDRRFPFHPQTRKAVHLFAIRGAAVIFGAMTLLARSAARDVAKYGTTFAPARHWAEWRTRP